MNADVADLSFALAGQPWLALAVVAAAVFGTVWGVWDLRRWYFAQPAGKPYVGATFAALLLLRVACGVLVALLGLQPQWTHSAEQVVHGRIALLVDRSRSMSSDALEGVSRQGQAQERVRAWLDEGVPVRMFGFGTHVQPLSAEQLGDDETLQEGTSLSDAIEAAARMSGAELGAVVLVSDGRQTSGAFDVERIVAANVRVHTVAVGGRVSVRDDAVLEADAPAVAFVHQPTRVRVKIRAPTRAGQAVTVLLYRGDDVVVDGIVQVDGEGVGVGEVVVVPDRVGRTLYRVVLPAASDDPVPQNNERAVLMRVARERTRVLLVSGRPGWDARYLRGLLNADPAVDLITFFILRTATDVPNASPNEMSLIPFPTDELFREHLTSFDVVIFQDFEYGPYEMARYLPGLARYVLDGGAFAMVGGGQSFGAGGYARTAVAEVLPVLLMDGVDVLDGPFVATVAGTANEHPIVHLLPDAADNRALWGRSATLIGTQRFVGVREGAQVLLNHPSARISSGAALPVLAVSEVGKGRVLALGADSSWRWGIATAARGGDASMYERFWDRALRWLMRDPQLEPSSLDTDQERYSPGAPIAVTGIVRDRNYAPLSLRELSLALRDLHGAELARVPVRSDPAGAVVTRLDAPARLGAYQITIDDAAGQPLVEQVFAVERSGPELADVSPDPERLAEIAKRTGGIFVADIADAPDLATFDRSRTRIEGISTTMPFKEPWVVILVIALLSAEWFLRKRSGLR